MMNVSRKNMYMDREGKDKDKGMEWYTVVIRVVRMTPDSAVVLIAEV